MSFRRCSFPVVVLREFRFCESVIKEVKRVVSQCSNDAEYQVYSLFITTKLNSSVGGYQVALMQESGHRHVSADHPVDPFERFERGPEEDGCFCD